MGAKWEDVVVEDDEGGCMRPSTRWALPDCFSWLEGAPMGEAEDDYSELSLP